MRWHFYIRTIENFWDLIAALDLRAGCWYPRPRLGTAIERLRSAPLLCSWNCPEELTERLRRLTKDAQISASWLAKRFGRDVDTFFKILAGKRRPSFTIALRWAALLEECCGEDLMLRVTIDDPELARTLGAEPIDEPVAADDDTAAAPPPDPSPPAEARAADDHRRAPDSDTGEGAPLRDACPPAGASRPRARAEPTKHDSTVTQADTPQHLAGSSAAEGSADTIFESGQNHREVDNPQSPHSDRQNTANEPADPPTSHEPEPSEPQGAPTDSKNTGQAEEPEETADKADGQARAHSRQSHGSARKTDQTHRQSRQHSRQRNGSTHQPPRGATGPRTGKKKTCNGGGRPFMFGGMVLVEWVFIDGTSVTATCRATEVDVLLAKRSELRGAAIFVNGRGYSPSRLAHDDLTELKRTVIETVEQQIGKINAGPDHQFIRALMRTGFSVMADLGVELAKERQP